MGINIYVCIIVTKILPLVLNQCSFISEYVPFKESVISKFVVVIIIRQHLLKNDIIFNIFLVFYDAAVNESYPNRSIVSITIFSKQKLLMETIIPVSLVINFYIYMIFSLA